ncbi:phosphoinositide-3-kinase-interacting protein 1, partial [Nematolebias whitei]|uniref:phosphoinositide-3-kinase-interacting protein 1 n=1 Tax=Nematolebias whitei TaxID=451745 RepID=UPI00189A9D7F
MSSVKSAGQQLLQMFLSLHVVFLSVAIVASNADQTDCVTHRGLGYRGEEQKSSTGLICLNWTNTTRDYDDGVHPDSQTGVGDHNYCRNPDASEIPWCYITAPDGTIQRQFCTVEACKEQTSAVAEESLGPTVIPPTESFKPTMPGASQQKAAAVQPVMGISQRVRTEPKKKK